MLVGAKGSTKKRIQFETKTTIKIPKQGVDGLVEIIGPIRQSVISARRRLELIIIAARHKQDKTHFLCVPVTDQSIREKFVQFKVSFENKNIATLLVRPFQSTTFTIVEKR